MKVHFGWHGGALPAGTTMDYVVEWAPGVDPTDDKFTTIGHAEMSTMAGDIDAAVGRLVAEREQPGADRTPTFQPDDPANKYIVTLARARDLALVEPDARRRQGRVAPRRVDLQGSRSAVAGFPIFLGSSGEGSPKIADLLGDGKREIVFADTGGLVHAIPRRRQRARRLAGRRPRRCRSSTPAHGNHGHGAPAFSGRARSRAPRAGGRRAGHRRPRRRRQAGDRGGHAGSATCGPCTRDGSVVAGFPVELDRDTIAVAKDQNHELADGFFASPVLADLDGDGKLDIIAAGMDGKLYAWHGDGSTVAAASPSLIQRPDRLSRQQRQRVMSSPAVGDLNKDGMPDIVVGSNEDYSSNGRVFAVSGKTGAFLPGWPVSMVSNHILPVVGKGVPCSPAMVDIDGDGMPEMLMSGIGSVLHVFDAKRQAVRPGARQPAREVRRQVERQERLRPDACVASPAVGDLDNDGTPDLVEGGAGADFVLAFASGSSRHDFEHHVARVGQQDAASSRTASRASSRTGSSSTTPRSPTSTATASPR